jgi:subfamily B ATP-binding cassette protein MsbA
MQHSGTYRRLYNMQFSDDDVVVTTNEDAPLVVGLEGIA